MFLSCSNGFKNKKIATSMPLGSHPTQSTHTLPPYCKSPLTHCQILNECCIHPDDHVFFALHSWMLINWEGCWMHLHTYHINTDKAACAKQARQTAAVNSQLDLRQSWTATEPRNKCIFHGRCVRARGEQTGTENECSSSIDSLVWRVNIIHI